MKKTYLLTAAFIVFGFASSSFALSLEFENQSSWDIHELYFSDADQKSWGPDQLDDQVIAAGETFTLTKIAKGDYDVKIVDEDGDSCEITDVNFTASEHFVLNDKLLLGCQNATAQEQEEAGDEE